MLSNEIEYKFIKDIDKNKLVELFRSVGWKTAEYPNRLYNAIKNSDYVVSAWNNKELIGLISTISDGYINVFITYLLIKPEYQKNKIESYLMDKICEHYKGFGRRILSTEIDKEKFYNKFGFEIDGIVMFNKDWKDDSIIKNNIRFNK